MVAGAAVAAVEGAEAAAAAAAVADLTGADADALATVAAADVVVRPEYISDHLVMHLPSAALLMD